MILQATKQFNQEYRQKKLKEKNNEMYRPCIFYFLAGGGQKLVAQRTNRPGAFGPAGPPKIQALEEKKLFFPELF